ncbi:alcohol dehydrogenase catalytic domain-containing protein [Mammaliicoccus sciuri]|uniref:alcohol dehydrogenase catalytic domain-containing protein n=1 Tax=Mammaliicoccus sciuri TaxID=1296 RepID=UPI003F549A85
MKAIIVSKAGNSEVLEYCEVPKPILKNGWSLIKIKGFGINHSEIFTRQGKSPSVKFPRILGIECVGVIEETSEPDRLPIGQKVISIMGEMGREFDGSYAEYVLVPNKQIYPINTDINWIILASLPETYYTAYGSFLSLNINENDTILVRGASSGVGIAFTNIIKSLYPHIRIVGTTRNTNKRDQLINKGYTDIIIDKDGILETKYIFSKIIDLIGPKSIKNSIMHLKRKGIICSVGLLGNTWHLDSFDPIMELREFKKLTSFYSGDVDEALLNEIIKMVEDNHIQGVKPEKIFKLDEIQQAHQYLENKDNSLGKVIVMNE